MSVKLYCGQTLDFESSAYCDDIVKLLAVAPNNVEFLAGDTVFTFNNHSTLFEQRTKLRFSPKSYRDYRLQLVEKCDGMVLFECPDNSIGENAAFELAFNIYKANNVPVLILQHETNVPNKDFVSHREFDDLAWVHRVMLSDRNTLKAALDNFVNILASSDETQAVAS